MARDQNSSNSLLNLIKLQETVTLSPIIVETKRIRLTAEADKAVAEAKLSLKILNSFDIQQERESYDTLYKRVVEMNNLLSLGIDVKDVLTSAVAKLKTYYKSEVDCVIPAAPVAPAAVSTDT